MHYNVKICVLSKKSIFQTRLNTVIIDEKQLFFLFKIKKK
jgi:hypothetical protein